MTPMAQMNAKTRKHGKQPIPLRLGDIVRVLDDPLNDDGFAGHIAVVTEVDLDTKTNGGYPYRMHVVSGHEYTSEIWFQRYERIGNVNECVELLTRHTRARQLRSGVPYQTAMR
jgi:hypothetical protein